MYIQKEGSPTDFLDQCIMHLRYVFIQAFDSRPFKERLGNQLRRLEGTLRQFSPVQHLPKLVYLMVDGDSRAPVEQCKRNIKKSDWLLFPPWTVAHVIVNRPETL